MPYTHTEAIEEIMGKMNVDRLALEGLLQLADASLPQDVIQWVDSAVESGMTSKEEARVNAQKNGGIGMGGPLNVDESLQGVPAYEDLQRIVRQSADRIAVLDTEDAQEEYTAALLAYLVFTSPRMISPPED